MPTLEATGAPKRPKKGPKCTNERPKKAKNGLKRPKKGFFMFVFRKNLRYNLKIGVKTNRPVNF